jgi:enoyl-CoA hydratase
VTSGTGGVRLEAGETAGVLVLTLDDPDRRNALSPRMMAELIDAVASVSADRSARVLVVTGAGSAFCAGGDLSAMFGRADRAVSEIRSELHTVYDSFLRVGRLPIPTIAAVNGPAVGAGLALAFCCDVRLAGPAASFGATFTRIGLHPGGGCTYFLVRALGQQRAFALLLDGGTLSAGEALESGIVLQLSADPLAAALALADRYARLDPDLVRDIKQTVDIAADADLPTVLQFEAWAQASSATRPDVFHALTRFSRPARPVALPDPESPCRP